MEFVLSPWKVGSEPVNAVTISQAFLYATTLWELDRGFSEYVTQAPPMLTYANQTKPREVNPNEQSLKSHRIASQDLRCGKSSAVHTRLRGEYVFVAQLRRTPVAELPTHPDRFERLR